MERDVREQSLRVLVVEDNPSDTELVERQLRREFGVVETRRVETMPDLEAALTKEAWDLLLVDYSLPELSAPAALDRVSSLGLHIPAIVVSGSISDEIAGELLKAGAADFLIKDRLARLGHAARAAIEKAGWLAQARAAELSRSASEALYRNIVNSTDDAIFANTTDGLITSWNRGAERLYGYLASEMIGRPISLLAPGSRQSEASTILAQVAAGTRVPHFDTVQVRKDGSLIDVTLKVSPIKDGERAIVGSSSIARNITDRERARKMLIESEQRLEGAERLAHLGHWVWDVLSDEVSGSDEFYRVFGLEPHAIPIVRWAELVEQIDPDDRESVQELVAQSIRDSVPFDYQARFRRPDGTSCVIESKAVPELNRDGRVVCMAGTAQDVTDRTQTEDSLRQAQKMEAVGLLAGGIAHDFNNLLTAIIGFSSLVMDSLPEDDPRRELVHEIADAGDRAAVLTRQLLAFSRKQILRPQLLCLNTIVADMDKLLRRVISEDIDLVTNLAPDLGATMVDPGQIEQIIVNLAVNARDAMPDGGKLTIETANVELDSTYLSQHLDATPGPYVLLVVTDTGFGMDHEIQSHIFEPFFTTKEVGRGTGLGLSTVFGIVKQSGGDIHVCSIVGRGTTFKVYLPRLDLPLTSTLARVVEEIPRGDETVLLVEDEPAVRSLARAVLESLGYTVVEVSRGADAIAAAATHPAHVDLLLTDMVMPEMGGRELATRLMATNADIKILYMSGFSGAASIHQRTLDPSEVFLAKPFTPFALATKVREALGGT
ncbi:MAG: sensor hybrid histidine kinase [Chloroflexi bacterium]|nr:sensor hybrid histidine kinase [Chloroflexota bacterium]